MKPHPLEDIQFLFFTENGGQFLETVSWDELLRILWGIAGFLKSDHPSVKLFEKELHNKTQDRAALLLPLKFWAKHCIHVSKQDKVAAFNAFVNDLCVPYIGLSFHAFNLLKKVPSYRLSDYLLDDIQAKTKNSIIKDYVVLHDPENEKYGYAKIFKVLLGTYLFYLEVSHYSSISYVPPSVLMIANEMFVQADTVAKDFLKEMISFAVFVGVHMLSIDAPWLSIFFYTSLCYTFIQTCQMLVNKYMGSSLLFNNYIQQQFIMLAAIFVLQRMLPPQTWFFNNTDLFLKNPENCLTDIKAKWAAANYFELPIDADIDTVQKRFHQFSRNAYTKGAPRDNDVTFVINAAYECLTKSGKSLRF